ncbi:uncharacterized protein LOC142978871 [Anticarsia gemmatalis]|uniref:uncharacterized protein LOC142978871 n=1 Tax=Anticarsia gemmatalis TaxID=129554 RepID=UPI003F76A413
MKGIAVLLLVVYVAFSHARVPGVKITPILVDECPKEQEIDWTIEWLMRHEDCNKFYKCTFGQPITYRCPGDLYFNLETWQCDWQHNVDCEDRNIPTSGEDDDDETTTVEVEVTSTTTLESTTSTTTEPPTTPTTEPPTTTPEPTTTTTTTTTTTPAPTTTTTTTTTTTPAPTTTTTTTTTPAPTTTTTTTTTPAPTTTTTTTTTPAPTTTSSTTTEAATTEQQEIDFLPNGCPVNPHIHWLLPHEYDCNLFYYCVWGQKVLRNCPGTLHFNTELQVCDHVVDAGCTLTGSETFNLGQWFKNLL